MEGVKGEGGTSERIIKVNVELRKKCSEISTRNFILYFPKKAGKI